MAHLADWWRTREAMPEGTSLPTAAAASAGRSGMSAHSPRRRFAAVFGFHFAVMGCTVRDPVARSVASLSGPIERGAETLQSSGLEDHQNASVVSSEEASAPST